MKKEEETQQNKTEILCLNEYINVFLAFKNWCLVLRQ